MIEGLRQGVIYEGSSEKLRFHLRDDDGNDVTSTTGTPTITVYNPSGVEVIAATNMTQVGSTAVQTYDIDVSNTTTYPKATNYRAKLSFVLSGETYVRHEFFDVCAYPFNEILFTTEELALKRPGWELPEGWADWTEAIEAGHVTLQNDLLDLRDESGERVYPFRLIDRTRLRQAAIAYCLKEAAIAMQLPEKEMGDAIETAAASIPTLVVYDRDDDLTVDGDEDEAALGITLRH